MRERSAAEAVRTEHILPQFCQCETPNNDEIGILTKEFNKMVFKLQETTISKSYLDNIISSINDSLIILDLDGTISKINHATCSLLGYNDNELIGKNIQFILANSSISLKSFMEGKVPRDLEIYYLHKEGNKIPVTFSCSCIKNDSNSPEGLACLAKDITEKKRAEQLLKQSEERYALAARAVNDGLWDWNLLTNEIYLSPRWKYLLGYEENALDNSLEEWFGRIHLSDRSSVLKTIFSYIQNPISHLELTYRILHQEDNYRWMQCRGIAVKNEAGKIIRLIGSQTDITQSRLDRKKLVQLALYDSLTNLPNRSFLMEKLQKLFEISKDNSKKKFFIFLLDLDGFKKINDSLGHLIGDRLLIQFAARIKTCLNNHEFLARLGGDEFAIISDRITNLRSPINLAEDILKQLKFPFNIEEHQLFVSVSIGIAEYKNQYLNIENLLRDADTAMYRAKASGKNCYQIFESKMYLEVKHKLEVENCLRQALDNFEFQLFYQPIVQLNNHQILGFEVLLRWQHQTLGTISPSTFISIAEETGLIIPLGQWVLEQACFQLSQWQKQYQAARSLYLSINLSPIQLKEFCRPNSFNFIEQLKQILLRFNLAPQSLNFEITETAIIESLSDTQDLLQQIKNLGIKLSMDDFGTGYSSLNSLHNLPIDILKIDRSFIEEITVNREKLQLIKTILNLADNLNLSVIAEGIETNPQLSLLQQLQCQYGQGYLFSKPINSQEVESLINTLELLPQYFNLEFGLDN